MLNLVGCTSNSLKQCTEHTWKLDSGHTERLSDRDKGAPEFYESKH